MTRIDEIRERWQNRCSRCFGTGATDEGRDVCDRCLGLGVGRARYTISDIAWLLAEVERLRAEALDDRPPQEGTDEYDELSAHEQAESDQWWYEWARRERK